MVDKLKITRSQLGTFIKDHNSLKQFEKAFEIINNLSDPDALTTILGELSVGSDLYPSGLCVGEGCQYLGDTLIYSQSSSGEFTDITSDALTGEDFTFPGVTVDNALYAASTLKKDNEVIIHHGYRLDIATAGELGASGAIILEYWDGTQWARLHGMAAGAEPPYFPLGTRYVLQEGSCSVRYDIVTMNDNTWVKNDPMGIGEEYYWVRARIAIEIESLPVFKDMELFGSVTKIHSDGFTEFFGNSRPISQLPLGVGGDKAFEGSVADQTIYIDQDLGSGLTENRFNSTTDKIGRFFFVPYEMDTSCPFRLRFAVRPEGSGTVEFTVRWGKVTEGDTAYISDPGDLGGVSTLTQSKDVTSGEVVIFDFFMTMFDVVSRRQGAQPDIVAVSIHLSNITASSAALFALQANYVKWCEGSHIELGITT